MKIKAGIVKPVISILVSLVLIVSFTPPAYAITPVISNIEAHPHYNPTLYAALHTTCGLDPTDTGDIWASDMEGLSGSLDLNSKGITNIDGLQYCSGVTALYLSNNPYTAMPVEMNRLTSLVILGLGGSGLTDASPNLHEITLIPNLRDLGINSTGVTDVGFLSTVSSLRSLAWSNCSLTPANLATVSGLTQLQSLSIYDAPTLGGDIRALSGLTNLRTLLMGGCGVKNLEALSGMSSLQTLNASDNYITDITPLSGKPITTLSLTNNYLNPQTGSSDRAVLDGLGVSPSAYETQHETTIGLANAHGHSSPDAYTAVYYDQSLLMPEVTDIDPAYVFLGWDTNGDGTADHAAGETIPFAWPTLPISGDFVQFSAVYRPKYTDCTLTELACSEPLSPAFSPSVTSYTVQMPISTVDTVTIKAMAAEGATLRMDGEAVDGKAYTLAFGETKTANITVTSEDGAHTLTYTVTIQRDLPAATLLLDPGISAGTLNPAFDPNRLEYALTLPEGAASVRFTPVKANTASKLHIEGRQRSSYTLTLKNGQLKAVKIRVIAPSRASRTYIFKVVRAKSTNAYLASLTTSPRLGLSPAFDRTVTTYTATVPEGKAGVTVRAAYADRNATVYINGSRTRAKYIPVAYGTTKTVTVRVKAQAGNTLTYTLTLRRPPHIVSFRGSPKADGKPTVTLYTLPARPVVFTYVLARYAGADTMTTLELYSSDGATLIAALMKRADNAGTRSFTWNGTIEGQPPLLAGTYRVKLSICYLRGEPILAAAPKWLTVVLR